MLAIDEHGDRKAGDKTAHIGRQYLSNLGKIDNGVVSVTSLWADERVYYPVDCEPYTPAHHFAAGKQDPAFRTKLKLAVELVRRALSAGFTFRAVVADSFYGEDRGVRQGLRDLKVGYVLALKPSHTWWHPIGSIGSLEEAAQAAGWKDAQHPGQWIKVVRTFRDGSQVDWWGLEVVTGPYGPHKQHRVIIATTDPETLPVTSTMYLITNLPHPDHAAGHWSGLPPATLEKIVWLYGLRMWIEESYKQVKHVLGWSEYQVRSDRAIRRHWQLVCCAFCFCWHHQHDAAQPAPPAEAWPSRAAERGEKKAQRVVSAPASVLAPSAAGRAGLVGTLDAAAAVLARVVHGAPTACLTASA